MQPDNSPLNLPALEQIVDRHPLTVEPNTLLADILVLGLGIVAQEDLLGAWN